MSSTTGIDYLDATWNPIVGCSPCSTGCRNCWAEQMANRLRRNPKVKYPRVINANGKWNGKTFLRHSAVVDPLQWKTPKRICVCFMGDMFHESVMPWMQNLVMRAMWECRDRHTFLILTKRPLRAAEFFQNYDHDDTDPWPWPHVWVGTSVENQRMLNLRIVGLSMIPAAVRFISAEPLVGQISLKGISYIPDWIVAGCESGTDRRVAPVEWFESLVDEASQREIPVYVKQMEIDRKIVHTPPVLGRRWVELPKTNKPDGKV